MSTPTSPITELMEEMRTLVNRYIDTHGFTAVEIIGIYYSALHEYTTQIREESIRNV